MNAGKKEWKRRGYTREQLLEQADALTIACHGAVREALLFHKRNGNSIAFWEDGKVKIIPPDQIKVDDVPEMTPRGPLS